jgi:hypothetical protein
VALAAQVDVAHLGLSLEDGAQQVREALVEREDLLELVEDDHDAAPPLRRELAEQLEQPLDRVVDVLLPPTGLEAEAQAAVGRIDIHDRDDPKPAEEVRRPLERLADGRGDVCVNRLRERGCEALLRRRLHQVAVADERLLLQSLLGGAEHQ